MDLEKVEEALKHYQKVDDDMLNFTNGFNTKTKVDEKSPARIALAELKEFRARLENDELVEEVTLEIVELWQGSNNEVGAYFPCGKAAQTAINVIKGKG